jgi:hypothetical protein
MVYITLYDRGILYYMRYKIRAPPGFGVPLSFQYSTPGSFPRAASGSVICVQGPFPLFRHEKSLPEGRQKQAAHSRETA